MNFVFDCELYPPKIGKNPANLYVWHIFPIFRGEKEVGELTVANLQWFIHPFPCPRQTGKLLNQKLPVGEDIKTLLFRLRICGPFVSRMEGGDFHSGQEGI